MTDLGRGEFGQLKHRAAVPGRRRGRSWLLAILVTSLGIGCAGGSLQRVFEIRPVLRVGISPTHPPVIFEKDGAIMGIEADLARMLGEELDRRIEFTRVPPAELLDALEKGDFDIVMSGLSITPERAERILFVTPYMKVGQLALIRANDLIELGHRRSIHQRDARVGYQRDTTGESFVANQLPRATSFAFADIEAGIRSLRAERIDFFVHDAPAVWRLAGDPASNDLQGLYHPLTDEHLAWAVRQEDEKLHSLLEATLSDWKHRGLISPILNRWIPVRVTLH
jgi:polar amino acid transport system substrate-binding protein